MKLLKKLWCKIKGHCYIWQSWPNTTCPTHIKLSCKRCGRVGIKKNGDTIYTYTETYWHVDN